jgi:hypothetical protein
LEQGTVSLQSTVDGNTHRPLTRFGVQAFTKQGSTVIRIVALDEAAEMPWTANFLFDPYPVVWQPGISA